MIDCNSNYIEIRICITKNTRLCNEILITIHLFGDNTDDTRKIITLYSSMMGRPDLQPQPVKVRTRKTRPE